MKFSIYTLNDNGSGIRYNTKEEFIDEISKMINDCFELFPRFIKQGYIVSAQFRGR